MVITANGMANQQGRSVVSLSSMADARAALSQAGMDPSNSRMKVLLGAARWIGNTEGLPAMVISDTTQAALHAEFRQAVRIHDVIPQASVQVLGSICHGHSFAGYVMQEIPGESIIGRFMGLRRIDEEAASREYIEAFKSLHRSVNQMNSKLVAHGDIHEKNVISGKLIDPQPYFPSGYVRRPGLFLIYRDQQWLAQMARRIAHLTGASVAQIIAP